MHPTVGRRLSDIFNSDAEGQINHDRDHVLLGKERHDVGRPYDWDILSGVSSGET